MVFRLGFVTGTTPDKWARAWRERSAIPLELVPLTDADQSRGVDDLDMCLIRQPIVRDDVHRIPLYDETPVVVLPRDHYLTLLDQVPIEDLADEQLIHAENFDWRPTATQLSWPQMTPKDAIEVVASGQGIALVPMSVARLFGRKDVATRPVLGLAPTTIALVWRRDRDDETTQSFVGVVRGRTSNSSRG